MPSLCPKLSWNFLLHLVGQGIVVAAVPMLQTDNISQVCRYIIETWPAMIACNWKIVFYLQHSGIKYRYFIWAKQSKTRRCWRAVMVHSTCLITILLASLDIALPSEREKWSWIDWAIKNFPSTTESTRWVLLGQLTLFRARRSRFRASHCATY